MDQEDRAEKREESSETEWRRQGQEHKEESSETEWRRQGQEHIGR